MILAVLYLIMAKKSEHTYFILLGTNLGNKIKNLQSARIRIQEELGPIALMSSVYQTAPWGRSDQDFFLNQVIMVDTHQLPEDAMTICLNIEKKMGRVRHAKWTERIIDVDILYINDEVVNLPQLIVPHPELHNRRFTLVPLVEIAPDYVHPGLKKSNQELLEVCPDRLDVSVFNNLIV